MMRHNAALERYAALRCLWHEIRDLYVTCIGAVRRGLPPPGLAPGLGDWLPDNAGRVAGSPRKRKVLS
eukprot:6769769-Prymnesium_polylepis.1